MNNIIINNFYYYKGPVTVPPTATPYWPLYELFPFSPVRKNTSSAEGVPLGKMAVINLTISCLRDTTDTTEFSYDSLFDLFIGDKKATGDDFTNKTNLYKSTIYTHYKIDRQIDGVSNYYSNSFNKSFKIFLKEGEKLVIFFHSDTGSYLDQYKMVGINCGGYLVNYVDGIIPELLP